MPPVVAAIRGPLAGGVRSTCVATLLKPLANSQSPVFALGHTMNPPLPIGAAWQPTAAQLLASTGWTSEPNLAGSYGNPGVCSFLLWSWHAGSLLVGGGVLGDPKQPIMNGALHATSNENKRLGIVHVLSTRVRRVVCNRRSGSRDRANQPCCATSGRAMGS